MKTRMKTLSVAMGAALGLSAVNAQADALLFPYFQSGNGSFTFLSLQSLAGVAGDFSSNPLVYVYNYDDPVLGACTHFDTIGSMSQFDLMQHTVTAPGLPGGLDLPTLFGDASTPGYLLVGDTQGFLTVQDTAGEALFTGQAIVVDSANGVITAYKGHNNILSTTDDDFSFITSSQILHMVSWYPVNAVDTRWFTLVTGLGMDNPVGWGGERDFVAIPGGVWDRDEAFLSGVVPFTVDCYATVDRNDFMNAGQLAGTVDGGMTILFNAANVDDVGPSTGALMVKVETEQVGALAGVNTAISLENALPNLPY